jgi:hypothetical protein
MGPNIPEHLVVHLRHVRADLYSDWQAGRVSICEQQDLVEWKKIVEEFARELGVRPEIVLNEATDMGFARVNKGFPLGMSPYSAEAKEWADLDSQVSWKAQLSSWNRLFRGDDRGIC